MLPGRMSCRVRPCSPRASGAQSCGTIAPGAKLLTQGTAVRYMSWGNPWQGIPTRGVTPMQVLAHARCASWIPAYVLSSVSTSPFTQIIFNIYIVINKNSWCFRASGMNEIVRLIVDYAQKDGYPDSSFNSEKTIPPRSVVCWSLSLVVPVLPTVLHCIAKYRHYTFLPV